MVPDFEIKSARLAPAPDFHVVRFVPARRHRLVRQVRDVQQHGVQLRLDFAELRLGTVQRFAESCDLVQQRLNILACGLGLADGL